MKLSVIILGSNPATKLALIRCVGDAFNCDITVINMVYELPSRKVVPVDCESKYVKRHLFSLKYHADSLYNVLMNNCRDDESHPVILSVDDDSAYLVDTILDKIQPYFFCADIGGRPGAIGALMNKRKQKLMAQSFGLNVSDSWVLECIDGSYVIPDGIRFPCYVKGLMSYHSLKNFQGKCVNRVELQHLLKKVAVSYSCPMIAEEYLNIDAELGIIGTCTDNKCVIPGVVELLDSGHGAHKGVSAFGKVNGPAGYQDVIGKITDMMSSINLNGLFNVDLAVCGGKIYFVELNLRFAAYGYAVSKAGANLPALFIQGALPIKADIFGTSIPDDMYYVNERVILDDFVNGYRSLKQIVQLRKKADFGIMESDVDPRPYAVLRRQMFRKYLSNVVKKLTKNERR